MLAKQSIDIPVGPLDTSNDPRRTPPGRFTSLVNAVFDKGGRLNKRRGYVQLGVGGMPGTPHSLAALDNKLLVIGAGGARVWDPVTSAWLVSGPNVSYTRRVRASTQPFRGDAVRAAIDAQLVHTHFAAVGVYEFYTYRASATESGFLVHNTASGRVINAPFNSGLRVKFAALGTMVYAFELNLAATSVSVYAFDTTATITAMPTPTAVALGVTINPDLWDVAPDVQNNCFWLPCVSNAAVSTYRLVRISTVPALVASYTQAASGNVQGSVTAWKHPDLNSLFCSWGSTASSNSAQVARFAIGTITFSAPSTPFTGAVAQTMGFTRRDAFTAWWVCGRRIVGNLQDRTHVDWYDSAGISGGAVATYQGLPTAKPFTQQFELHFSVGVTDVAYTSAGAFVTQAQTNLVGEPANLILGRVTDDGRTPYARNPFSLVPWYEVTTGVWRSVELFVVSTQQEPAGGFPTNTFGIRRVELDFNRPTPMQSVQADGLTYLVGSLLQCYDGFGLVEATPVNAPYTPTFTDSSSGGAIGMVGAQTFLYRLQYAWVDAKGNEHRGPLSTPRTRQTANTGTLTSSTAITCVGLAGTRFIGDDEQRLRLVLYRSPHLQSTLYLSGSSPTPLAITDVASDTALQASAQLNTSELEPTCPPGFDHIARVGQRLWGVHQGRAEAWYSKLPIPGYATEWAAELTIPIPTDAGFPVAVADMDGTPVILTTRGILRVVGDGPDNTGQGGDYLLVSIPGSVGCVSAASVAVVPDGVLYLTAEGWRLLDRSFQLARGPEGGFFGVEVDDYKTVTVHSSVAIPEVSQIRYIVSGVAGVDVLVYDWERRTWTTFDLGFTPAGASTVWQGRHVVLGADNAVWVERLANDANLHCDGSSYVLMSCRTGWLSYAGIEGYQRLWRVTAAHENRSAHGMSITVESEYGSQTRTWSEAEIVATPAGRGALQLHVRDQKAARHRITISDTAPATNGTGEGYTLLGMQLEVGIRQGSTKRLPPGSRK